MYIQYNHFPQFLNNILFPKLWHNGIPGLPLWWNPLESEDCSRLESPGCDVGLRTGPHSGMCWVNRVDSKGFGNGFLSEGRSRGHLTRRSSVRNSETKQMKLMYKRNTMGFFSKIICFYYVELIYKDNL